MTDPTLADIGEGALLARLHRRLNLQGSTAAPPGTGPASAMARSRGGGRAAPRQAGRETSAWQRAQAGLGRHDARRRIVIGVGDDAAVLALGPHVAMSTDMVVEGVDFERRWASPHDVGHKAAAAALSDLAAMGAAPRALLASLAVPASARVADVLGCICSLHRVGRGAGAPLVGGDVSQIVGPWVLAVTALGEVAPGRALRRYLGRVGDWICVSGRLGAAAAGLYQLRHGGLRPAHVVRQLRPTPRLKLGQALAAAGCVRAAADLSDGLAQDAMHVVSPGLGVTLHVPDLPLAYGLTAAAAAAGVEAWRWAASGGEDYELVCAVAPDQLGRAGRVAAAQGIGWHGVGRIVCTPGLRWTGAPPGPRPTGFMHFGP